MSPRTDSTIPDETEERLNDSLATDTSAERPPAPAAGRALAGDASRSLDSIEGELNRISQSVGTASGSGAAAAAAAAAAEVSTSSEEEAPAESPGQVKARLEREKRDEEYEAMMARVKASQVGLF